MTPHLRDSAQFSATPLPVSRVRQLRDRLEDGRMERPARSVSRVLIAAGFLALLSTPVVIAEIAKDWPLDTTLRHFAAATGCTAARAVKLVPARTGEPGYWPWLDRSGSGVSCAPSRVAAGSAREGAANRPPQSAPQTPASRLRGAL